MRQRPPLRHGVNQRADDYRTLCGLELPFFAPGGQDETTPNLNTVTCRGCQSELRAREVEARLSDNDTGAG